MGQHEQLCDQQPVICWGCGSSPPLASFSSHDPDLACFSFRQVHDTPVSRTLLNTLAKFEGKFPLTYTGDMVWNPLAVRFAGQMFYLRVIRVQKTRLWVLYVAAQLLTASCSKYLASISVSS